MDKSVKERKITKNLVSMMSLIFTSVNKMGYRGESASWHTV